MFPDQSKLTTFPARKSRLALERGFNKEPNPGRRNCLRIQGSQDTSLCVSVAPWTCLLSGWNEKPHDRRGGKWLSSRACKIDGEKFKASLCYFVASLGYVRPLLKKGVVVGWPGEIAQRLRELMARAERTLSRSITHTCMAACSYT